MTPSAIPSIETKEINEIKLFRLLALVYLTPTKSVNGWNIIYFDFKKVYYLLLPSVLKLIVLQFRVFTFMLKTIFTLLTLVFSQFSYANKVIKGGNITIYNENPSDISYGPSRGQAKKQVIRAYGQPNKKSESIGEPTITRWYYRDFTVFFQGSYVIQSVINQQQQR